VGFNKQDKPPAASQSISERYGDVRANEQSLAWDFARFARSQLSAQKLEHDFVRLLAPVFQPESQTFARLLARAGGEGGTGMAWWLLAAAGDKYGWRYDPGPALIHRQSRQAVAIHCNLLYHLPVGGTEWAACECDRR
jgi:hypothetical protein